MLDPYGVKQTGIRQDMAEMIREPHRAWCFPWDAYLDVKPGATGSADRFY